MINHDLKCIFIHIPATGGSIIEKVLTGKDWQQVDPKTKHMDPSLAKIYYKDYWDIYFKFAFVRNPYDWMVSMYSKTRPEGIEGMLFLDYVMMYMKFTSMNWEYPLNRIKIPMCYNTTGLDFVGKFENIEDDFNTVCNKLHIKRNFPKSKIHKNKRDKDYKPYYDDITKEMVELIFEKDLEEFNYEF